MTLPDRKYNSGKGYRFGFNGMENDDEVKGEGNSLDFGARIYDSRIGRWLSTDPLQDKYPGMSPYNFVGNNPSLFVDYDGRDFGILIDYKNKRIIIYQAWAVASQESYDLAVAYKKYREAHNDIFVFETKDQGVFDIVFEVDVYDNRPTIHTPAGTDMENEARKLALEISDLNYLKITGSLSSLAQLISGRESLGKAEEGGNYTRIKENIIPELKEKVLKHEIDHTLGIDHELIGKQGHFIDERTIGTTLLYAYRYGDRDEILPKGVKKKWLLGYNGGVLDEDYPVFYVDYENEKPEKILKGKVRRKTTEEQEKEEKEEKE